MDWAVALDQASKKYLSHRERPTATTFKSYFLHDIWQRRRAQREVVWAVRGFTLGVGKGEMVGVIGRNGSGKSTLLKMIGGILKPDSGMISANGRVAALIELGAGFHPELTGWENVFINGIILGLSKKEIKNKIGEIIDFAEIGDFINAPVRTYSSGMYMRLAFSVAINVVPDILLIDEILSVGDEKFQAKCLQKIHALKKMGTTIILVSHNLNTIEQMCDRVCLMDQGRSLFLGTPTDAISSYHRLLHGEPISFPPVATGGAIGEQEEPRPDLHFQNRWGSRDVEITAVYFLDAKGSISNVFGTGDQFVARIEFVAHRKITQPVFGIAIYREDGTHINGPNTRMGEFVIPDIEGKGIIEYSAEELPLLPGRYAFTAAVYDYDCIVAYDHWEKAFLFTVVENQQVRERYGVVYVPSKWRLL